MKKFYPIVRRKFHWKLLLITIMIFAYPSISEATTYGTNLVTHGNADNPSTFTTDWSVTNGPTFVDDLSTNLGSLVRSGNTDGYIFDYFLGWNNTGTEYITQTIDISDISTDLSNGKVKAVLSGYVFRRYSSGTSKIIIEQLNASGTPTAGTSQQSFENTGINTWQFGSLSIDNLNALTRKLKITLYAIISTDDSGYSEFDGIDLTLYRWPTVTNTAAITITASSAVLGGNVTTDGNPANTERGIVYSTTNTNPTIGGANVTKVALGTGSGTFNQTITGLSGAQIYYYNAYATNTLGTVYGTVNNFTTLTPTYLTATTNDATSVTINSATLNGSVNANGRTTNVYFEYGTSSSYGTQVAASPATATGTSATTETLSVTGLSSTTTYHFRMAAYNSTEGWKYGVDKTFMTLTPVPEMDLKQSSTAIADGGSFDFGSKLLSSNTDIVFTIQNTGTSALTLTTPITIVGTNADQFSIQSQPTSPVAAAGSSTFTIRFSPTSTGSKSASISIGNNDSNENPYDLTIVGQGYAAPTVTTGVQTINTQGVNVSGVLVPMTITTLKGSVNANNASTAVTFEYGTTTAYGTSVTATGSPVASTTPTPVTCTPTLFPNTTYHYRVVGTNIAGSTNGADQTFTTPVIEHFTDETTDYAQTFTEGGTTFTMTGYLFDKYEGLGGYEGPDCFYDAQMISNLYNVMPTAGIAGSIKNATNNFYVNNFWIAPGNASYTFGQYGNVIIRGKRSGTTLFTYTLTSANTNNSSANNYYTFIDLSSYSTYLIDELEFEVTDNIRYLKIDAFSFNYPAAFAPTVTTQAVGNIGSINAIGNGNITNLGNPNPTAYGICWKTSTGPTISDSHTDGGVKSTTGTFTGSMTGLTAGATYYVRAYATNAGGTSYGGEVTFTTYATASTWTGTGNWSTAGNWSAGIPGSETDVTISSGTCTLDNNYPANNITLNSGAALTVSSGKTLTISGNLTLKSDATGTASLINNGTLTISGTTNAERYMTGNKWHIVSPTAAGGTVAAFLTANSTIPTSGSNRGMMDYNTTSNSWNSYYPATGASGTMDAGKGYSARITSDGVVTFSGTLTSGTKPVTLTKVGTGDWNCIGNPYPSAIKMNTTADATNNFIFQNSSILDGSYACVYVWDEDASYTGQSCYKIISNSGFISTTGRANLGQDYVAPGQGFFVKTATNGNTVQFTAAMQVHQPTTGLKSASVSWPGFQLTATTAQGSASTIITFNNAMTTGLDVTYDAGLLRGISGLELYSRLVTDNGVDFAIQCLPESYPSLVIPLGLDCKTGGEVTFSAETVELPAACSVILEDKTTKTFTSLAGGATYKATVPAGATGTGRFYIHTNDVISGVSDLPSAATFSLKVYPANGEIIIEGEVSNQAKAALFDLNGKKLGAYTLQRQNRNTISVTGVVPGVYLLNVNDSGKRFTTKIVIY